MVYLLGILYLCEAACGGSIRLMEKILSATCIESDTAEQRRFYLPFEKIEDGWIPPPNPDIPD